MVPNADNLGCKLPKKREAAMIRKKIINPDRMRGITGGFIIEAQNLFLQQRKFIIRQIRLLFSDYLFAFSY